MAHFPGMSEPSRKTALVTGAAKRIGRAIALKLADAGWDVAIHYNASESEAQALARDLSARGGRAVALAADLAREDEARALLPEAAEALGPVTCLVNNASIFEDDSLDTATRDSWDAHMAVNLRAPFVLMQAFAKRLPDGADGNVVNLIDQRVWSLTPFFASYTMSKAGLWTLTRTAALALAPRIRVNAIGPGPTLRGPHQTEEEFARQWSSLPLARQTRAEEIGDAVLFLLSQPSMTGQMIVLDGGQHLAWCHPSDIGTPDAAV